MKKEKQLPSTIEDFQPLNDLVLLKPIVHEMVGRIHIPSKYQARAMEATALAVGPGKISLRTGLREPMEIEPGDHVFVRYYHEADIHIDGEMCMMLPIMDIIGVIEPK